MTRQRRLQVWKVLAVALLAVHAGAVFWLASRLQICYYDNYMYYVAAWSLIDPAVPYSVTLPITRQPVFAMLLSPFMGDLATDPFGIAFRGPFLLAAGLTAGYLVLSWAFLRRRFGAGFALAGLTMLIANRLIVHYGPFPMHDICTALAVLGCGWCYLWARRRRRWWQLVLTAAAMAATIALKTSLGLILPILGLTELTLLAVRRPGWREAVRAMGAWIAAGTAALAAAVVFGAAVFAWKYGSWGAGWETLLTTFREQRDLPHYAGDRFYEYLVQLPLACSWTAIALALAGVAAAVRWRKPADLWILWLVAIHLGTHMLLPHQELRYTMPLLIGIAYLAVAGLRSLPWPRRWPPVLKAAGLALVLIPAIALGAGEWARFADPLYTRPFLSVVGNELRDQLADGAGYYFTGNMTPLTPKDDVFHPWDEYFYYYHLGPAFLYIAGAPRLQLLDAIEAGPERDARLGRERALVVRLYPRHTQTIDPAVPRPPVRLDRYRLIHLRPAASGAGWTDEAGQLRYDPATGHLTDGAGAPLDWATIFLRKTATGGEPAVEIHAVRQGVDRLLTAPAGGDLGGIALVTREVKLLWPPGVEPWDTTAIWEDEP